MTARGEELHAIAAEQIAELIGLVSTLDEAGLRLPCPGREKLGDGTAGASLRHTADNYQRIAAFVQTSDRMSGAHQPAQHGAHRVPRSSGLLATDPQTTPNTAPAPANMATSTQQTPSIRARWSNNSPTRAPALVESPS